MEPWTEALLYVALAGGYLLSRFRPAPRLLLPLSNGTVLALVGSLGVLLSGEGSPDLWLVLLPSLAIGAALVFLSAGFARGLLRVVGPPRASTARTSGASEGFPWRGSIFPSSILAVLVVGYLLGSTATWLASIGSLLTEIFLLLLLFEVGWEIRVTRAALRALPVPLAAAALGAAVVAVAIAMLGGVPWNESFALVGAFGWYTLAGPVVSQAAGPNLGLIAFLSNFLRENLTMVSAPWLGRSCGAEGVVAAGGATSMDTTLYFATRYGRKEAGPVALASGTVLTLIAPVLLALLLRGG